MKVIYIAGGCFWGVEGYFQKLKGITHTSVGYINGNTNNPNYKDLKAGLLTHAECVKVIYDPSIISLTTILEHMMRFTDPTTLNQQGDDIGIQYRSGIYYDDVDDEKIIKEFLSHLQTKYPKPLMVEASPNQGYYLAEDYHQDYLNKNPNGYCHVNLDLLLESEKK